jgi:hypothetical protein
MNINVLQNIVVDRGKVKSLVGSKSISELEELFNVKQSQAYYLKRGDRMPTIDGLLRLMMLHNLTPGDLAALEK